ncbi:hypothetical protein NDU88_000332 [Pleurodeles waltl]|uniref:Myb/SANT-like DNA-binding domain-containing protein n=1 Tax=Pleurodeles waltl TaxID=8319 RepID=A0AAV7U377_PLEWA|nr:hypothetical protein NDU88_000332 [Pleurodeles waltl]
MARQRHPRFSEEELRVMVEEIVRVEPQLFGAQVQHTSIARKMALWRRIVDRVNAVGQHPRNREDIRNRWNDLRGKVRSVVSRHHLAVQRTGGRPPPPPPQLTTWEKQVLAILHPEGLARVGGGMDSGTWGSGSGHTVQGTEAQEQRGTGRAAVRQGADRPSEPTLHEALSNIMGAYHHSQETMATVLAKFHETQRLQEEQYSGFREELRAINSTLGTIVRVLKEVLNTRRDNVALQGAPDTSMDNELPTTSTSASGQEAPPQDHHTRTPPPAEGEPPHKRSLRSRTKTENDAKTPAKK